MAALADVNDPTTTLTMPARDITITALFSSEATMIPRHGRWKHHDQGQDLGTAAQGAGYDDVSWPSGPVRLGCNDVDTVTDVGFDGDAGNELRRTDVPGRICKVDWNDDLRIPFAPIATGITGGTFGDAAHAGDRKRFCPIGVEVE